jgi:hypothetical protein
MELLYQHLNKKKSFVSTNNAKEKTYLLIDFLN